jgi:inhibitor of KinA
LEPSHSIFPLGDSAITIDLGNHIDEQLNRKALAIQNGLAALRLPGIKDIIVAYSSVSVFYDPVSVIAGSPACRDGAFTCMKERLEEAWLRASAGPGDAETATKFNAIRSNGSAWGKQAPGGPASGRDITRIPVCYEEEYGPDLGLLIREKGLPREDIIRLHTSRAYRVYMIGFLPGFPYLGKVDPRLEISRKDSPVPVAAGGVGIAGNQTGIYPLNSPGGWQIIGRTPLKLFDPNATVPVRLTIGNWVQFYSVSRQAFQDYVFYGVPFEIINDPPET